jgi:hypothetical protein
MDKALACPERFQCRAISGSRFWTDDRGKSNAFVKPADRRSGGPSALALLSDDIDHGYL